DFNGLKGGVNNPTNFTILGIFTPPITPTGMVGNSPPVANNLSVTTAEDTATNLVLTATDVDSTNLTYAIVTQPTNGTLSNFNTNSSALTNYPTRSYYGGADGTRLAVDGESNRATATVSITVTPVNDTPTATNLTVTTPEDTATNLVLLGSDVESAVTFAIL